MNTTWNWVNQHELQNDRINSIDEQNNAQTLYFYIKKILSLSFLPKCSYDGLLTDDCVLKCLVPRGARGGGMRDGKKFGGGPPSRDDKYNSGERGHW